MDGADSAFDYPALVHDALLGVVRTVLARAAEKGLPGDHHFYLTFGTADDGVVVPASQRRQFPEEMTIVLQHQFWNLAVDDAGFAVTLRFGGKPERLRVPWPALRAFMDPSVEFGFKLQASEGGEPAEAPGADTDKTGATAAEASAATRAAAKEPKVVAFRPKGGS